MNTGKAVAIIKELNSTGFTDTEKLEAIFTVADMETHNSITKDSLVNGIRWIKKLCEEPDDDTAAEVIDEVPAADVPHEMTAREYIREHRRMCDFYFGKSTTDGGWCGDCPFRKNGGKDCWLKPGRSESSISIVEEWAREHPEERSEDNGEM